MKRFAVFLLMLSASAAYGEMYTWKDARGTVFYTNSLHEIPARYLKKARILDVATGKKIGLATAQPAAPSSPASPPGDSPAQQVPAANPVATPAAPVPAAAPPVAAIPAAPVPPAVERRQMQRREAREQRRAQRDRARGSGVEE